MYPYTDKLLKVSLGSCAGSKRIVPNRFLRNLGDGPSGEVSVSGRCATSNINKPMVNSIKP